MISVIIPTYKEPDVLDICLNSLFKGQDNNNEIIVIVDGFKNLNQSVLDKYPKHSEKSQNPEVVISPRKRFSQK